MTSRTRLLAAVAVLAGLVAPAATVGRPAAAGADYDGQQLTWESCPDPGALADPAAAYVDLVEAAMTSMECASFRAPLDWADPAAGPDVTIAVSRLRPPGGAEPQGAIFTNPGGPGAPGLFLPVIFALRAKAEILTRFEIVGIDVRGTGRSSNVGCDGQIVTGSQLDVRDQRPANLDLILDSVSYTARACQHASGKLGTHITTEQTVRDLDLLRSLLGRPKVSWVGYSGGTWLGAYYATYFPDRVDRFVLDSNADFTGTWRDAFRGQAMGFQRRFDVDFVPWVAAWDRRFGLGATPEAVLASYEALRAEVAAEPIFVDDETTVYPGDVDSLVTGALYAKRAFQATAELLGDLRGMTQGRLPSPSRRQALAAGVAAARRSAGPAAGLRRTAPDAFEGTFLSIICGDHPWPGDRSSLVADSAEQGRAHPLFGWYALGDPCVFWQRTAPPPRLADGAGVPPVLMVQSERDPATPIEGARRAAARFAGARLLIVTDEGDHGLYLVNGNACVDDAVDAFLLSGALPAEGATCPGEPIPPPRPVDAPAVDLLDLVTGGLVRRALAALPGAPG